MERGFDLCGIVRRIRRQADMSQRELAAAVAVSPSAVAHAEAGTRDLPARALARAAEVAGLRLALLDAEGAEVEPMIAEGARDRGGRRLPAHLDVRYSDEDWWHGEHRYAREQPWYTFDRLRYTRDFWRDRTGTPHDHQPARPGDSPHERAEARRRELWRRAAEERQRRFEAGEFRQLEDWFTCECPPRCEELDDYSGRPVHGDECRCRCDVG